MGTDKVDGMTLEEVAREVAQGALPPGAMYGWMSSKDSAIAGEDRRFVGDGEEPPCFGGVYVQGDNGLVPAERAYAALPERVELDAWLALSNSWGDLEASEVATLVAGGRPDELHDLVDRIFDDDDTCCFYTEIYPDEFTEEELDEMRESCPHLFDEHGEPLYDDETVETDDLQPETVAPVPAPESARECEER